ncbi:MAG TPA: lipoyl(octanoyl) transferase LipB [Acidobacteriaceae bacterium]|nr:lipoyl(octanoyl) transferase LipB [Acidobacteriaceae bacterium]
MSEEVISLLDLGRQDYAAALALQQHLCALRQQGTIGDVLLLVEHPPVLTLGRNARRENVLADDALLARRGIDVFETNRGGDVTYHGPGQLVGYPILNLRGFNPPIGIVAYLRRLEEVLIRACADYGILTQRSPGRAGVWTVPGGSVAEKKVAALGVHVARGVTTHGFALNVTTDLEDFALIVPCGISDRGVTSVQLEAERPPTLEQMAHSVSRHFGRVFERQMVWLEALDDLLPSNRPATVGLL